MTATDIREQFVLPPPLSRVSELVEARPQAFLSGDEDTHTATLHAAKYVFDLSLQRERGAQASIAQLLRSIEPSARPQTRSQTRALGKHERSPAPPSQVNPNLWLPTPLDMLHLEGMDDDQVWAQLELRAAALCDALKVVFEEEREEDEEGDENTQLHMKDEDEDLDSLEDFDGMDEEEDDLEGQIGEDEDEDEVEGEDEDEEEDLEGITELRDPSDDDSEDTDEDQMDLDRPMRPSARSRRGGHGDLPGKRRDGHPILDDGFFSLADFNAETEEAEAKHVSKGHLGQDEDVDDDEAEDDVDLFAAVDDVGGATFEEEDLEEGGESYYKDFFAAPSHKAFFAAKASTAALSPGKPDKASKVRFHDEVRVKKIKSRGKGNSVASMKNMMVREEEEDEEDEEFGEEWAKDGLDDDHDMDEDFEYVDEEEDVAEDGGGRETIERLKDDLFAEDDAVHTKDLSTHEARQAEIAAQIAALEAQSIAPKDWTLMGEATSRSRPVNSLLEEDLEFERVMKVVPVVTEERVSSLEDTIKKRILEGRFDDVVRKRPLDDKPFLPSRFFELNDQKSAQSLAQIYEDEYTTAAGGSAVDDRDGKLRKEHEELEKMWDGICHKLDALSNAHFTPKQPKATISTVSNLPTTTLESALPTTKSTTTMLAPEEIFAAPAEIRSRDELTPIEKRAHRNKQRKARKKAKDQLATSVDKFARMRKGKGSAGSVKKEKDRALRSVVKTGRGVTVVGKQSADLKRQGKGQQGAPVDGKRLKL